MLLLKTRCFAATGIDQQYSRCNASKELSNKLWVPVVSVLQILKYFNYIAMHTYFLEPSKIINDQTTNLVLQIYLGMIASHYQHLNYQKIPEIPLKLCPALNSNPMIIKILTISGAPISCCSWEILSMCLSFLFST